MDEDNSHRGSVSSSVDDTSLVEDEDFQVVNPKRGVNSRRSSVAASSRTAGSQEDISAIGGVDIVDDDDEDIIGTGNQNNDKREAVLYGPDAQNTAVRNLIFFSILMFTVPLAVVYCSYEYFLEHLHLPRDQATLYAGILGAAVVYVIVVVFIWVAYREERSDEQLVQRIQKPETSKKSE